ncbi:sulfotransferase family protein [Paraburkholderia acidisoli]|uniref:Sulfotransferase family protein n=1 Tax=Paraburkholderia acidisoli TaxID=2571748 RepID=A0A7Z2GJ13_9BURK|nr:hypothetical protein [Paraburkholderia acidisoli]QGZ62716.1 hypothetical protein FAZ98_13820 [Paraburkholderia acidisoli]
MDEGRSTATSTASAAGMLLVVLGMHRSGTSATARAMAALGADLGDRLMPAADGNNDKGFFEDYDIVKLNVELMAAAGMEWHTLGEIDVSRIAPERLAAFEAEALATLRAKCLHTTFALKDPRLARLIRFWKPVFERVGVPVKYVLSVRHPLSVARSLAKRDGMAEEKALHLWLEHVVPSLAETRECERVIVDYDTLLDQPTAELERIAARLNLSVDAASLAEYHQEFLEGGLRHTRFRPEDLDATRGASRAVKQLYGALEAASRGTADAAPGTALETALESARQYLADVAPLLGYETRVYQHIGTQQAVIGQLQHHLKQHSQALTERDQRIATLETRIVETTGRISAKPLGDRQPLVISCLFGALFSQVHDAIPGMRCVFFSNNRNLKEAVEAKGWIFEFVKSHPLTDDYRFSSLQSKYIRYLQFFGEFPHYASDDAIIYCDHKFALDARHVQTIAEHFPADKSVLIRNTPRVKLSIQDEIDQAMEWQRYALTMPQTIEWLEREGPARGLSMSNRIMNTGLIAWKNTARIQPLLDEVYETSWRLAQPECQIIWALLSQAYEPWIQRIEWQALDPQWVVLV